MSRDEKRSLMQERGRRLRATRERRGLSQRALARGAAEQLPVSAAYVSRIESGERLASVPMLRAFAAVLDVSPEFLETGDELVTWKLQPELAERILLHLLDERCEVDVPASVVEALAGAVGEDVFGALLAQLPPQHRVYSGA